MQNPVVSFVIPCYKLAHLLPECVHSILSQTFGDLEVLIMDDCSPDNTAEVGRSFRDPRVKYVRNDPNLGPLRNYNKGIVLSRGKYVWLISADDYLRRPYILERYVELMERNPRVGYVFCPGVGVMNGRETGVVEYSLYGERDRTVNGRVFLKRLLQNNLVLAASAMARRECYETTSLFPVDVVWAGIPVDFVWGGDWYLWCLFALFHDVGYFAEPMVCYREHDIAMTNIVTQDRTDNCLAADTAVLWMVRQRAIEAGLRVASQDCLCAVAYEYGRQCASKPYRTGAASITLEQFETSLCRSTDEENERNWVRARVYARMGNEHYRRGQPALARQFYEAALKRDPWMAKVLAKRALLLLGVPGDYLRRGLRRVLPVR